MCTRQLDLKKRAAVGGGGEKITGRVVATEIAVEGESAASRSLRTSIKEY